MIEFSHVSFGYRGQGDILTDFSLLLSPGERVCLYGPSGAGKTTAARLLLGLEKPRRGVIAGREGLSFSAVFQEDRLLPWKTVEENVALFSSVDAARAMLVQLGLGAQLTALPDALSGGMKRRAALARALCHPFDVLVLDEALTGLDEAAKARCLDAIDKAVGTRTLLLVTHDASEAVALGATLLPLEG